jgi:excisionase family DNA binding protein
MSDIDAGTETLDISPERAIDTVRQASESPGQSMDNGDWSVKQAAELMGVSEKTIRRHLKDGALQFRRQPGKFGPEIRITAIPTALVKKDISPPEKVEIPVPDVNALLRQREEEIKELKFQLGDALNAVRVLEGRLKLLEAPKKVSWWQRVWGKLRKR